MLSSSLEERKKIHSLRTSYIAHAVLQSICKTCSESENQICYKKWVKNQKSGNGLSRRIDVVGCGNAVRKEGRKEKKN